MTVSPSSERYDKGLTLERKLQNGVIINCFSMSRQISTDILLALGAFPRYVNIKPVCKIYHILKYIKVIEIYKTYKTFLGSLLFLPMDPSVIFGWWVVFSFNFIADLHDN